MKKITLLLLMTGFSAFAQFPAPYCNPGEFTNNVEPITSVNFAGINNVSDGALNGSPDVEDFTTVVGNVSAGSSYQITLQGMTDGGFTNRFVVFADWNQDNDFADAGETYEILQTIYGSTGSDDITATQILAVPGNALAGNTRLRVKKIFGTVNYLDPCLITGYGQFEDYTLTVTVPSCIAPAEGMANVTSGTTADLSWVGTGAFEVVVQEAGGPAPAAANGTGVTATSSPYQATGLTINSMYEFYVRKECVDGTEFSTWSGPYTFNTVQAPGCATAPTPADGATGIIITEGLLTFSWTPPATPVDYYIMYYGLTEDDVTNVVGEFEEPTAEITIDGFDTEFFWRLEAVNAAGTSSDCEIWSFTTESAPPAPENDDCSGAMALTPGGNFEQGAININTTSATTNEGDPENACDVPAGTDVWYAIVVPASGSITVETAENGSIGDTVLELYSGACDALVSEGCNDDETGLFSMVSLTDLTPGSTIYARVWAYGGESGTFDISAYDSSLLSTDNFNKGNFKFYPNPVKNIMNLSYDKNISDVAVYNLIGQQVIVKSINATQSQIDMSNLAKGTYVVKVTADNQVKTIKVIKE